MTDTNYTSGTLITSNWLNEVNDHIHHDTPVAGATIHNSNVISFAQSGIGATVRTALAKMSEWVSVKDFGAVGDGVTDDTVAIQKAIDYVKTALTNSCLLFNGEFVFNPTLLSYTGATNKVTWMVDGVLKPTTTITLNGSFEIIGMGGGGITSVQFSIGSSCLIVAPAGNIPVIKLTGSANHVLKNIFINGCYQGLYLDGATALGALARIDNVNVLCNQAGGQALVIDGFFWAYFNQCRFLSTSIAHKSILIKNTTGSVGNAGLIYFRENITSGRGISVNPDVGTCGNIYFYDHHHENLEVGEDFFFAKADTTSIYFSQLGISDPLVGAGYIFDVDGVLNFTVDKSYAYSFKSYPKTGRYIDDTAYDYTNVSRDLGTKRSSSSFVESRGAIHGRLLNRGHTFSPVFGLGTPISVALTPGTYDTYLTVTGSELAPDETSTAYKVVSSNPTSSARNAYTFYVSGNTLYTGDTVVFGAMVKAADVIKGAGGMGVLGVGFTGAGMTFYNSMGGVSASNAGPAGNDSKLADDGWIPIYGHLNIASGADAGVLGDLSANLYAYGGNTFRIWKPWMRIIRASSGMALSDAIKYGSAVGCVPPVKSGVVAIHDHQVFLTGKAATASRPAATSVDAGSQFYDTTLGKPIWSDGTNWKDAAGTIV